MSKAKKLIIFAVTMVGSLVAAISGLFISFFIVGKKIDKAYLPEEKQENESDNDH